MKNPKISFIVPVFNSEKYLNKCIDSIFAQKYNNFELILVDDGSTDGSHEICESYSSNSNVKVIHQSNLGVAAARNAGLEISSGDYIFFIDNDDWLGDEAVKILLPYMEMEIDLIFNKYLMVDDWGSTSICNNVDQKNINNIKSDRVLNFLRKKRVNIMAPWEYVVKRKILIDNSIRFDSNYSGLDDSVFSPLLFCSVNSFAITSEPLYFWRNRKNSQGKNHDLKKYILKMTSAIESLKVILDKFDGGKKKYIYFSIYKNVFSLFGNFYNYDNSDQNILRKYYNENLKLIKKSVKYSGIFHSLLGVVFGGFFGLIMAYKLASIKGYFYSLVYRVK